VRVVSLRVEIERMGPIGRRESVRRFEPSVIPSSRDLAAGAVA
jgi:hypothetical protein